MCGGSLRRREMWADFIDKRYLSFCKSRVKRTRALIKYHDMMGTFEFGQVMEVFQGWNL